jgi:uncharacterized protein YndB with AHSA1/START domain
MATTVKPAPILLSIETPADIETSWEALTDPDRVTEWFTDVSPLFLATRCHLRILSCSEDELQWSYHLYITRLDRMVHRIG